MLDKGQPEIKTRWVHTSKVTADGVVTKARLVAKGNQEKCLSEVISDSPTCSKESLRIILAIIASKNLICNTMDVKTAFLQGKPFHRNVYLEPPQEAKVEPGYMWKLNKCVHGLNDALREWYLTIQQKLLEFGATVSMYDQAVFTWHSSGKIEGVFCTHVYDFYWAGSGDFQKVIIDKIKLEFVVKTEDKYSFKYLGLDTVQNDKSILIKQDEYVKSIGLLSPITNYEEETSLTNEEISNCRSKIGKLNWFATPTRPDICFEVSDLASSLQLRKLESISQINKTIRKVKKQSHS